jgi:hypothetical protein
VKDVVVEIEWADADKEGSSIQWKTIHPWEDGYVDLCVEASKGSDPRLMLMPGGTLARCQAVGYTKRRDKVLVLGWRHTFERMIQADIPGVTRMAIGQSFGVDMLKYPVGAPEELVAALVEE